MEDYAIKFDHVSKIYKLNKKNDGKRLTNGEKFAIITTVAER